MSLKPLLLIILAVLALIAAGSLRMPAGEPAGTSAARRLPYIMDRPQLGPTFVSVALRPSSPIAQRSDQPLLSLPNEVSRAAEPLRALLSPEISRFFPGSAGSAGPGSLKTEGAAGAASAAPPPPEILHVPPRYVRYLQVLRRIMVLNGFVSADFEREITEDRHVISILKRFVEYLISNSGLPAEDRERRKAELIAGIRLDLELLGEEFPSGFRPSPRSALPPESGGVASGSPLCSADPSPRLFLATIVAGLFPSAQAQGESGLIDIGSRADLEAIGGGVPSDIDLELRADLEAVFGDATPAGFEAAESADVVACVAGGVVKEIGDCYRAKDLNPNPGVNLWAPCCNCSVPVPSGKGFTCVPVGCKNAICPRGNLIWDRETGICGCDQF